MDSPANKTQEATIDSYTLLKMPGSSLTEQYKAFVFINFLRSLRKFNESYKAIAPENYFPRYHKVIEDILKTSNVIIAVLADDRDVALGFSITENNKLHYVFVKHDLQRQGIAKSLIPKEIDTITHMTNKIIPLWEKYKFNFEPIEAI